jgi:transcriptional regulator with XRE-family HTH domain
MDKSEIKSLIKELMKALNLRQVDLAEGLGVKLDRVKSITSGKVRNLTREETEALINKYHVRAEWLATGKGPMFLTENELEFQRRLSRLSEISNSVSELGLTTRNTRRLHNILSALEAKDIDWLSRCLKDPLKPEERELLLNYRYADNKAKDLIMNLARHVNQTGIPIKEQEQSHEDDQ